MNNCRKNFFLDLIKLAARRDDIEALRGILEFKYPGDRRIPGFAVQYYEKFVKGKNLPTPLTEDSLPQPLPETAEELLTLLQIVEVVKRKTKKEEYAETILLKHPNVDLTNLNEDYLSWLNQRYVENKIKSGEIVHPIEEALVTLRKFPSIQDKYKASAEFREKVKEAGYADIFAIQGLTLDEMEAIISLDISDLTVRVDSVSVKPEEFLGKFGEWNLWLPHTKETSVKIAGYDESYNPKTTWCTARTKGSNLFYNYIGREDIPAFLFYIIKDNPNNNQDWLSLGYISQGNRLAPDFSGKDGGLSVDRANRGLTELDYSEILGDSWNSIKSRIEAELEKHKIIEGGEEKYVSPARSIIKALAKNVEEFKKELYPKSNEEKKDFIEVIMDSDPSEDVLKVCGKTLARIDPKTFLTYYADKLWAQPYLYSATKIVAEKDPYYILKNFSKETWAQPYLDLAAKNFAEMNSYYFLINFSNEPWAQPYLGLAANIMADEAPGIILKDYSDKSWAKPYIGRAAKNMAEKNPYHFIMDYSKELWAQPYIDLARKNMPEKDPHPFLEDFSEEVWAKPYVDRAANILAEKKPYNFLKYFSYKPWAKPYIDLAAKKAAKHVSRDFLVYLSDESWAEPYIGIAAENMTEKEPREFVRSLAHKPWAKTYLDKIASNMIEEDSGYFIRIYSSKSWAEPYLDIAAKNMAEKMPHSFLDGFSHESWAQPYIELAAKNLVEKNPLSFLYYFSYKSWAHTYIDLAAKKYIEIDPKNFLALFLYEEWAKPYIPLAKSKLKSREASSSIQNKLLKLSNFLKSNNLKEYNYLNYYIKE